MSNTLGFGLDVNRGGGGGFNPKKISGLALWLDASDLATITKDGSNYVSEWRDKSGNGRNAAQATGLLQPLYSATEGIITDGSNDFIRVGTFSLAQPTTILMVVKIKTAAVNKYFIDGLSVETGYIYISKASPLEIRMGAGGTPLSFQSLTVDTYAIITMQINGASSSFQVNSNTASTGDPGASNMGGITLGAAGNNSSACNAAFKEVICYSSAITATEIQKLKNYLSRKWSVTI